MTNDIVLVKPQPLDQNAAALYIASLPAETGRRTQAQALRVIAGMLGTNVNHLDWGKLRYQHTAAVRAKIAQIYKPATANKILSALRQTLKQAWLLGHMTAEDYHRAVDLEPITGETIPTGRELSTGEIIALMKACQADTNPAGTRDAAIISLLYAAGLRRDEVVKLNVNNFQHEAGQLILTGKRNRQRTAYIRNGAADALNDWLSIRGLDDGPLFVPINKGGKLLLKPMTTQAIYNMLYKRAQEAGIKNFSPHDLRRTFIAHLLEAGVDIATVSKMAGHANIQTTARYDRRPEEEKKKAAELLHVPYRPKKAQV